MIVFFLKEQSYNLLLKLALAMSLHLFAFCGKDKKRVCKTLQTLAKSLILKA